VRRKGQKEEPEKKQEISNETFLLDAMGGRV